MKAIGCLMIILSTTLTGCYLSSVLKKRVKLFEELAMFSKNIATAIKYDGSDLSCLIENENHHMKTPFTEKVTQYLHQTTDISVSFRNALKDLSMNYGLSKEDKALILQFTAKLGVTDTDGQVSHCHYFQKVFSEKAEMFKQESLTKSKLYRSLGFFSGLTVAVILV